MELSVLQKVEAIKAFKDWSNYLLVTTVASLGWSSAQVKFQCSGIGDAVVVSLAASVAFGILTLALIPLVIERLKSTDETIYAVEAEFKRVWMWGGHSRVSLKWVCWPQHIFFLLGIVLYAYGAARCGLTKLS